MLFQATFKVLDYTSSTFDISGWNESEFKRLLKHAQGKETKREKD